MNEPRGGRARVKRLVVRLLVRASGHPVRRGSRPTSVERDRVVHVLFPAVWGSLGDEALALGTQELFAGVGRQIELLVVGDTHPWSRAGVERVGSVGDARRSFGTRPSRADAERLGSRDLVVIGADTVSGEYEHRFLLWRVHALNVAARAGRRAALVNFSMSAHPSREAVRILALLDPQVELWARDPASAERTRRHLGREVGLAPDVAAMLKPSAAPVSRPARERRVVLVPNSHFVTNLGLDRPGLVEFWADLARRYAARSEVLLLVHDLRDHPGDPQLVDDVVASADDGRIDVVRPASAADAKSVLSQARLVVSARMHACVGALSTGVPALGLDYFDKFSGQFSWYDMADHVISFADTTTVDDVERAAEQAVRSPITLDGVGPAAFGWAT